MLITLLDIGQVEIEFILTSFLSKNTRTGVPLIIKMCDDLIFSRNRNEYW